MGTLQRRLAYPAGADIQREAKKTEKSVRECLKRGDARSARVLAKELVRTRAAVSRLHASRAQMNSVSLHLSENLGAFTRLALASLLDAPRQR